MNICQVGVELFHADRWSERNDIASGCVSQFCEHVYKQVHLYIMS